MAAKKNVSCRSRNDNSICFDGYNDLALNAQRELKRLDSEFASLDSCHQILFEALVKVRREELELRIALKESTESQKDKLIREKKIKEKNALQRLEDALFQNNDDNSEKTSDDDSLFGDMGLSVQKNSTLSYKIDSSSTEDEVNEEDLLQIEL